MNSQFVDLFDKDKYGVNYWAVVALFVGLMVTWLGFALTIAYQAGVLDYGIPNPVGLVMGALPGDLAFSLGFAIVLVLLCHVLKSDLMLPVAAGVATALVGIVVRAAGLIEAPVFGGMSLLANFAYGLFISGAVVACYRLIGNKLQALTLGFVIGRVMSGALAGAQAYLSQDAPLEVLAHFAIQPMPAAFLAGVFFYAGISHHFARIDIDFTEYGLVSVAPSDEAGSVTGIQIASPGKTRKPLVTSLLLAVTLHLYLVGWIYKVYSEIRARSPGATSVTPGRALGFLFIPGLNLLWVIWLFIDLPRAIRRMTEQDPPNGISLGAGLVTGLLVAGVAANLVGAFVWTTASYLGAVLLWGGVLSAQSALNSHWRAHLVTTS